MASLNPFAAVAAVLQKQTEVAKAANVDAKKKMLATREAKLQKAK